MIPQTEIEFEKEIYSHTEIQNLLTSRSEQDKKYLIGLVEPICFKFKITRDGQNSYVFKTESQITTFIQQFNNSVSGNKKLTFDYIKNSNAFKGNQLRQSIFPQPFFSRFFSLDQTIPNKVTSFEMQKLSGGRYSQCDCFCFSKWKTCKAYITNDGLITYDKKRQKIRQFLAFGKDFDWEISRDITELKLHIYSYHRKLSLRIGKPTQFLFFIMSLSLQLQIYKSERIAERFNSFGPVRNHNQVDFLVDGAQYFESVANKIQAAKEDVFICGWWVSPEFFLKRPCTGNNLDYRLDNLLARVAAKGVKIYVIVYYQSSFLTIDSNYTKETLQKRHQNIKVLRHPQIKLPTYWSHHEKLIVIDQSLAFLGGLDLCYGRYDNQTHRIDQNSQKKYPGIQYNNCRIADFNHVKDYKKENVSRQLPRLPWHDVGLCVRGTCVKDLSRHFIEYWNYASYQTHYVDRYTLVSTEKRNFLSKVSEFSSGIKSKLSFKKKKVEEEIKQQKISFRMSSSNSQKVVIDHELNLLKISNEKDKELNINSNRNQMSEAIFINLDVGNESDYDRKKTIQEMLGKELSQLAQIEQKEQQDFENFEQSKIMKTMKKVERTLSKAALLQEKMEREESIIQQLKEDDYIKQKQQRIEEKEKGGDIQKFVMKLFKKTKNKQVDKPLEQQNFNFTCQAVRSASKWSIGCKSLNFEKSIHDAYIQLIGKAQKFIYIENQFFISATSSSGVVKNRIMEAIANRIMMAIDNNQVFRVIVLLPLIPGFAGQLDDPNASLPRVIMKWQYKTICKGQNSLLKRIEAKTKDPWKYVQFFGLRTHGVINNKAFTEIIYLHSKLMIVDDKYLICGSANINDRSMEGNRDSELCLIVEGKQEIVNRRGYQGVKKIYELRVGLWEQHFGMREEQSDPVCEVVWEKIINRAEKNTQVYRELFGCYPDDTISRLEEIKKLRVTQTEMGQYERKRMEIKGHAVRFPMKFLCAEKLTCFLPNQIST